MKKVKITGIKKATGDFNNWIGHAEVMLDKSTGEVWTDIFASCGDKNVYKDSNVVRLLSKGVMQMSENWDKTSMQDLKKLAEEVLSR